jgi:hypothetical protein
MAPLTVDVSSVMTDEDRCYLTRKRRTATIFGAVSMVFLAPVGLMATQTADIFIRDLRDRNPNLPEWVPAVIFLTPLALAALCGAVAWYQMKLYHGRNWQLRQRLKQASQG